MRWTARDTGARREETGVKQVVLAYDGSDGAKRALRAVIDLHREGAAVTVIGVSEGVPVLGHAGALRAPKQEEERRRQVDEAAEELRSHGIAATPRTERSSDPAAAILDEAARTGADLVVMGTRGRSTAERWLLGSVSTKVLQHARCSVLVVR
jgi:nucleotide-binding universal stress UspA family protein